MYGYAVVVEKRHQRRLIVQRQRPDIRRPGGMDGCMEKWHGMGWDVGMGQGDGRIGDHGFCGSAGVSVFLSPPLNTNESTQAQVGHDWDDWELTTGRTNGWTNGQSG